jgi:hypothetical protein
MKKSINIFILPLMAGMVIAGALQAVIGYAHITSVTQLNHTQTDYIYGLMGFLFGFLPCFLYGLAFNWYEANKPEPEPKPVQLLPELPIFTGMLIACPGGVGVLRVKAIKVAAILEFNNPDYQDYL